MLYIAGEIVEKKRGDSRDVERAISAASAAFPEFSAEPAHQRAARLDAIARALAEHKDEMARCISESAKKPIRYARGEAERAVSTFTFAALEARRLGGEIIPIDAAPGGEGRVGLLLRVPRGPVGAITPFNFPLNLVAHKIAPALACGAPIVLKPAGDTPEPAVLLARIIHDVGVPKGALSVVPCSSEDAAPIVDDPRLPVLTFTGSAKVGWELKKRAYRKQVLLELGGDAAVIIEDDGPWQGSLDRLVAGAFAYAGQVCISVQRISVHTSVYDTFLSAFCDATEHQATVGDVSDEDVMVGPLIRTRDADRVMDWIEEARDKGAKVLAGGRRDGDTISPTILSDVDPSTKLACEEAFGPVVILNKHASLDEAIEYVNASQYGLQAGIFTDSQRGLMRAYRELVVGGVIHNDVPMFRVDHMPYGGVKNSGFGREGPHYAVEELTEPRLLVTRR